VRKLNQKPLELEFTLLQLKVLGFTNKGTVTAELRAKRRNHYQIQEIEYIRIQRPVFVFMRIQSTRVQVWRYTHKTACTPTQEKLTIAFFRKVAH
jgi:hypothetical protein